MSGELTKVFEKLEKWRASPKIGQEGQVDEVHGWRNPVELREHEVDAILSLRSAGDEEVDKLFVNAMHAIGVDESVNPEGCKSSQRSLEELHHLAVARGQTRTDAVNKAAEWAKECEQLQNQLREAHAEIERLKGDAERYRWLRSHSWHEPYHIFFGPGCNQTEPWHLDQAIDNEMKYPIIEGEQT